MLRTIAVLQQPVLAVAERFTNTRSPPKPSVPAEGFDPLPATTADQLDGIMQTLQQNTSAWINTSASERAELLRACLETTLAVSEEAATAATRAKGSEGWGIGEEMLSIAPILIGLRELADSLEAGEEAVQAHRIYRRKEGDQQWIVDVFPMGLEPLMFPGFVGEVWIEPGKEPTRKRVYQRMAEDKATLAGGDGHSSTSKVGVVLGAGNQTSVVGLDILHVLVTENRLVVCKMNPVNEYMGPYLRRAFEPLVEKGYVEFVYGGAEVGSRVCNHPLAASVHLTGSAATYDAIVWQGKPKQGVPPFKKPVAAELGCVTPYIVVPGTWSESDLEYQAQNIVAALTLNAGHNCLKAELVVTDAAWPQREAFLAALRRGLAQSPNRIAFYPGSGHKAAAFKQRFPDAEEIGGGTVIGVDGALVAAAKDSGHVDVRKLPWMLKTGLKPEEAATQDENWCGVLQEISLPDCNGDAGAFMKAAVDFANNKCWGTLSCGVIIHPATQKAYKREFDDAIADLRYGTVAINVPTFIGFTVTKLPWGGFPGASSPADVGSGDAKVHNTTFLDHPQKGVIKGAWKMHPTPVWFPSNRHLEEVVRLALPFYANPTLKNMLPVMPAAMKG